jgi:hypothetical protein
MSLRREAQNLPVAEVIDPPPLNKLFEVCLQMAE